MQLIEAALEGTTGTVYVLLENATLPPHDAARIEELSKRISPYLAFVFCSYLDTEKIDSIDDNFLVTLYLVANEVNLSPHDRAELEALDGLHNRYKDSESGQSRLQVLHESSAGTTNGFTAEEFEASQNECLVLMKNGQLEEALAVFKRYVVAMAILSNAREDSVAEKVARVASEQTTSAVFVRFGTHHSRLYPLIRERVGSAHLRKIYLDTDESSRELLFDPETAAIRKVQFRGAHALDELQWYKAMIGGLMYTTLETINREGQMNLTDQDMIRSASDATQYIQTLQDVERFRQKIVKSDIITAMMESFK